MKLLFENWRQFLKEDDKLLNEGVWDTLTKERSWSDPLGDDEEEKISDEEYEDFIVARKDAETWADLLNNIDSDWVERLRKEWPLARKNQPQREITPLIYYSNYIKSMRSADKENRNYWEKYMNRGCIPIPCRFISNSNWMMNTLIKDADLEARSLIEKFANENKLETREAYLRTIELLKYYSEYLRDVYYRFKPDALGADIDLSNTPVEIEDI